MTKKESTPTFPRKIESSRLGTLNLNQFQGQTKTTYRNYETANNITIPTRRVRLDPEGLRVVIWVPQSGIPDAARFAAEIDRRFDNLTSRLEDILDKAVPLIESAIDYFWAIPDETAPTAGKLLDTAELRQINLNGGPGDHEIILFDRDDLIGGHDLRLELTEDFHPSSANFDG